MSAPRTLADATTMRVGGEVQRWIEATTRDEIAAGYADVLADDYEPHLLLGGGSNTVASSEPFDGTVLRIATRGIRTLPAAQRPHRPASPSATVCATRASHDSPASMRSTTES